MAHPGGPPKPRHPAADRMATAKQPATVLAGRYGHPLHPALVALPIGAWVASLVFDLASHLASDPLVLAQASRWLIGLGVLAALVAATAGFLDLLPLPGGTRVFRVAIWHLTFALTATGGFAAGFVLRADPVAPVPPGPLALSAAALAALGAAGHLGGTLAYRYGVRVAGEDTQAAGYTVLPTDTPEPEEQP